MLQFRGFHDRVILLLISACALLFVLEPANSQMSKQEKQSIANMIATEINRAITAHQTEGIALREKVVGRLMQCGSLYVMMSKQARAPEASKSVGDVAEISYNLSALVSEGIAVDRFKEIAETLKSS